MWFKILCKLKKIRSIDKYIVQKPILYFRMNAFCPFCLQEKSRSMFGEKLELIDDEERVMWFIPLLLFSLSFFSLDSVFISCGENGGVRCCCTVWRANWTTLHYRVIPYQKLKTYRNCYADLHPIVWTYWTRSMSRVFSSSRAVLISQTRIIKR